MITGTSYIAPSRSVLMTDLAPTSATREGMSRTERGVARAAALFERVDPGRAAELLSPVLAGDPSSASGWILMARIRLVLDQVDEALAAAERAIPLAPEDARPLAIASRALTLLGQHADAVTLALQAVALEPRNALWRDRAAWAMLASGHRVEDAETAARTATRLAPDEAHHFFTHGVVLDALGRADEARQALLTSLRLEPDNTVAQHRLAVLNGEKERTGGPRRRGWRRLRRSRRRPPRAKRPEEYL
jgi:tetratricopeptide (TPR) repeat protein